MTTKKKKRKIPWIWNPCCHLCAEEDLTHRVFECKYEVIGNIYENPELLEEAHV